MRRPRSDPAEVREQDMSMHSPADELMQSCSSEDNSAPVKSVAHQLAAEMVRKNYTGGICEDAAYMSDNECSRVVLEEKVFKTSRLAGPEPKLGEAVTNTISNSSKGRTKRMLPGDSAMPRPSSTDERAGRKSMPYSSSKLWAKDGECLHRSLLKSSRLDSEETLVAHTDGNSIMPWQSLSQENVLVFPVDSASSESRLKHGGSPSLLSHRASKRVSRHASKESLSKDKKSTTLADAAARANDSVTNDSSVQRNELQISPKFHNSAFGKDLEAEVIPALTTNAAGATTADSPTQESRAIADARFRRWNGGLGKKDQLEAQKRRVKGRARELAQKSREDVVRHKSAPYPARGSTEFFDWKATPARSQSQVDRRDPKSTTRDQSPSADTSRGLNVMRADIPQHTAAASSLLAPTALRSANSSSKTIRRIRGEHDLKDGDGSVSPAEVLEEAGQPAVVAMPIRRKEKPAPSPSPKISRWVNNVVEESDGDTSMDYDWFTASESSDEVTLIRADDPFAVLLHLAANDLIKQYDAFRKRQGTTTSGKRRRGAGETSGDASNPKTNKRGQSFEDDPTSGEDAEPKAKSTKRMKSIAKTGRGLACPFWKRDPNRHRDCYRKILSKIKYVKSHLYNCHDYPIFCAICHDEFSNETVRDNHTREQNCPRREPVPHEGLTKDQRYIIQRRINQNLSEEENWFKIWDVLFQGATRPASAYIDNDLSEDLCNFEEFRTSDEGTSILQRYINDADPRSPLNEQQLRHQRQIIRTANQTLYDRWLERTRPQAAQVPQPRQVVSRPTPPPTNPSTTEGSLQSDRDGPIGSVGHNGTPPRTYDGNPVHDLLGINADSDTTNSGPQGEADLLQMYFENFLDAQVNADHQWPQHPGEGSPPPPQDWNT
jgi:hypothetical protein